jgi:AraC-like DNA-binding protein
MIKIVKPIQAEIRSIHFFTGPDKRVLSRRIREPAQLIVILGGVYLAHVDESGGRRLIRAQAGDVVFWGEGAERTEESVPDRPTRCITLYLNWPGLPAGLPPLIRDSQHVIDFLANRLLALSHDPGRKPRMAVLGEAYLNAMLAEFINLAENKPDSLETIAMRYAEEHMTEAIRLGALARHAGLTPSHFSRTYQQLTGRSPIRDVQQRKAAHARTILLQNPRRGLRDVARRVGVKNEATLSRLLKKHTGVTARDIKRAAKVAPR